MCHNSILRWLGRTGVLVLLLLFTCQLANGQGRLYWTEPSDYAVSIPSIKSSNLDGSSVSTVARGFYLSNPLHLDIDQETGWVYWTDQGTAQISRSSPDGSEGGVIIPSVATPHGIAVDGVNGYVYWTTKYPGIVRMPIHGSDYQVIAPGYGYAMGLEISIEDDLIFWTHGYGGTYRAHLDGSDIIEISPLAGDGLAVDGLHDRLYMPQGNVILKMDFEGAQVDTVVQASSGVDAVVVEPAANRLCWSQVGETAGSGAVMCAGTDGSNVTKILDLPGVPHGLAINRASRMIYFTLPGRVVRCNHDGTGLEDVVQEMNSPVDVAVDPAQAKVYWADDVYLSNHMVLKRSNLDGREFEDIEVGFSDSSQEPGRASALALDLINRNLYLGSTGTPGRVIMGPFDGPVDNVIQSTTPAAVTDVEVDAANQKVLYVLSGELRRQNLDGTDPTKLFSSVGSGIAVSQQYLYWLDVPTQSLRRGNLDGTEPVDLLMGVESIRDLAVDASDTYLFWSTPGERTIKRLEIGQSAAQEIVTADVEIGGLYVVSTPSKVTQIAPLSGAADLPTSVTLMWSGPPDAQRFDVQVASGENINSVIFASNTPHTEETFVAPVAESSYYWRVRSTGAGGNGPFTAYQKFSVGGSGPLAATLLDPDEGETGVALEPTFRWTKASEAVYHQIQVADNSSFASPLVDVDSLTDDYFGGVSLAHEATYYWRVAGISADGKYTFTAPRSFTTVVAAPEAVTLISPPNEASGLPTTLQVSWSRPPNAERFDVQVASGDNIDNVIFSSNTPNTVETFVAPLAESSYYWRVRSTGAGGNGPFTAYAKFSVGESGPLTATLLEPAEDETGVVVEPTFRWTKASEAVYHQLQVADNSSFTNPLIDVDSLADDYYVGGKLAHETAYYWRVAGIAADGKYTFTAPRSFTTIVSAPEAITLLSPDASEEGVPAYATFAWQLASDTDSYRFELASDSLFASLLVDVETDQPVYALESPLAYDTKYFWRVCGMNEGGEGAWSEYRAFRTVIGTGITVDGLPSVFALGQNFPNPFGLSTEIRYDLPRPEHVSVVVYDALGRHMERLVDSPQPAGSHVVTFEAADHPGGLYFYRMRAGSFEKVMGMVVAR